MIRISVRQQLSLLLILSGCIGLAVLAIAVWVTNHDFVIEVSSSRLEVTASLKAAQVAFNLEIMQTAAAFVTTRILIQQALARYDNGSNTTESNWAVAQTDLNATLGDVGALSDALVLQAQVYARNASGPAGTNSVLNSTGRDTQDIQLPWLNPDGSQAYLGQGPLGYPPSLYPNLTISSTLNSAEAAEDGDPPPYVAEYNGLELGANETLILGPLSLNESFSLLSLTLPVVNNTLGSDVLGWITVVVDARLIQMVVDDTRGLGNSGQTLLIGPTNTTNQFSPGILGTPRAASADVKFLLPLNKNATSRHPNHTFGTPNPPFQASAYPAVEIVMRYFSRGVDDYGSLMRTHNEENKAVSVGYSTPATDLVDWIVIVEQARSEVWKPINRLRGIILACLFGVAGFLLVVSFPIAHWFVLPIRRLRAATQRTVESPDSSSGGSASSFEKLGNKCDGNASGCNKEKPGIIGTLLRWRAKNRNPAPSDDDEEAKPFRIPGKVKTRKVWIKDEMSDLIRTFNEMSDELMVQYTKLEDKVRERTNELEQSKKAAESANESKTLFVANVSHELKTPLNGILGMSAVAMEEDDPQKLKTSLGIIYKSGDLLLRTLSDLLTFSTNQVGHQVLKLEERDFTLRDLETQVLSIFADQAKDRQTHLRVDFEDTPGDLFGVSGTLRDAQLWGDMHRILQVVINLVSNALKFTPAGGSVTVTIRCLSELPPRRGSLALARTASALAGTRRPAGLGNGTANFINPHEATDISDKVAPPAGSDLFVEFEITDTGAGIPKEMQSRIFEPFIQGDSGLSRKHSGTGLGLSICSQLATLMRGTIHVRSIVGQGSTFTVKLPLRYLRNQTPKTSMDGSRDGSSREGSRVGSVVSRKTSVSTSLRKHSEPNGHAVPLTIATDVASSEAMKSEKAHSPLTSPNPPPSPKAQTTVLRQAVKNASKEAKSKKEAKADFSHVRVLVAEDNKVNQEVIVRMLKLEKIHDVTIAEDGQIALDLVKTRSPSEGLEDNLEEGPSYDLIFMDVQMPNMDGLTSTKLIREHGFTRPIVALTAYAEQANIDKCYGSGMDYFLAKPIRRPQLKKVLTEYCTPSPIPEKGKGNDLDTANGLESSKTTEGTASTTEQQNGVSPRATDTVEHVAPDEC